MRKILSVIFALLLLNGCDTGPKFSVKGNISGAEDKMLYLEASGLEGIVPLDSVKLNKNGTFSFKYTSPESPEFYRLRIDNKVINFSIDSTELVVVKAPYADFSTSYSIDGSEDCKKIKELTIKQTKLQADVDALVRSIQANVITNDIFEDSLASVIGKYKEDVKLHYIYAAPNTSSAYFALFQKLNDYLIFDPLNNKEDIKCFAAVATSLNNKYPHADRSKNLYNIVIKGMKNTRKPQQKTLELPKDKIIETGVIDISLRDGKGNIRKLSDLKGKVVLLDFTIYQSAVSAAHNFTLRDLYNKYASKGLEIYQVSLDADEHFWRTSIDNLPWICVRDANGIYSTTAAIYNVKQVPAYFLVNRKNELSARGESLKDLDAAIKALL